MAPARWNLQLDRPVQSVLAEDALANLAGVTLRADWTVDRAIAHLRTSGVMGPHSARVLYLYVVDDAGRLAGVLSARQLLGADGAVILSSIMNRSLVTLKPTDTLFDACELFAMHRLLAIPVVTTNDKLLGTIDVSVYTDEVHDLAEQNRRIKSFN